MLLVNSLEIHDEIFSERQFGSREDVSVRRDSAVVEMPTRKMADFRPHPELNVESQHLAQLRSFAQFLVASLHEGPSEAVSLGFEGQDGGRKLERVANHHHFGDAIFDNRDQKFEIRRLTSLES